MTGTEMFQVVGAAAFGAIIGWFVYYINRYRTGEVSFADITTLVGAIGGAAILALFPSGSVLFAGYGIGLFVGFFGYFFVLSIQIYRSENFDTDWFIDGRRKKAMDPFVIPDQRQAAGGVGMLPEQNGTATGGIRGPHPAQIVVNTSGGGVMVSGEEAAQPLSVPETTPPAKKPAAKK